MKRELLAFGLLAVSVDLAAAGIYKCTSPSGSVSYQEIACEGAQAGGVANIPTSFPEVNSAERERLLRQVALLEQRELKRYEIDSNERIAMADIAAREREAQLMAQSSSDAYGYGYAMPAYAVAGRGAHLVPIMNHRSRVQHHIATGVGNGTR